MLDIELIRSDPDYVRTALLKRVDDVDLDPILEADALRRKLITEVETARSERNRQAREIGKLKSSGADTAELQKRAAELGDQVTQMQAALTEAEKILHDLLMELPNLPDDRAPVGGKEANQVVRTWGSKPDLGGKPLDHVKLCTQLGLIDYARGTKLGGTGFWLYTGQGAALEWALVDFFNREHYAAGYQFLLPPHMLTEEAGYAAGQFPKFHEDVYHIQEEGDGGRKSFLLPTAETAILNVYRDEILPVETLPLRAFSYTPCYRREAGGYRTEERGTMRGHQFNKVEMFQFTAPEQAGDALDELVGRAQIAWFLGLLPPGATTECFRRNSCSAIYKRRNGTAHEGCRPTHRRTYESMSKMLTLGSPEVMRREQEHYRSVLSDVVSQRLGDGSLPESIIDRFRYYETRVGPVMHCIIADDNAFWGINFFMNPGAGATEFLNRSYIKSSCRTEFGRKVLEQIEILRELPSTSLFNLH